MTTKINLNDLTNSDYESLLKNDKVWDVLVEFTSENTRLRTSDWLDLLDGISDYSLSDSSNYNYLHVSNSYKFLDSVLEVQKCYRLLTNTMAEKVAKLLLDYEGSDLDSSYEDTLDEVGEQVADALVNVAEDEYDNAMESASLIEAMKDYEALITIYGEDAYYDREDNKIYYTVAD